MMVDTFDRYTLGGEYFRWYRGAPVALPVRGRFKAYWSGPARSWWSISRQRTHSISCPPPYIARYLFHVAVSLRRNSIFCLITPSPEREGEGEVLSFLLLQPSNSCSDHLRNRIRCVYFRSPLLFFLLWQKLARSRIMVEERSFRSNSPGNRVSHRIAQLL